MFWLCQFQQKENQAINPDKPDSSQHLCFECKFCSFCWKTLGSFKVPSAWPYISPQEKQPVAIPNLRFFFLHFSFLSPLSHSCQSQSSYFSFPYCVSLFVPKVRPTLRKKIIFVPWPIFCWPLRVDWHSPWIYGQVVGANFETQLFALDWQNV